MKRRSDEIEPIHFPQLFYLLWYKTDIIAPQQALETYRTQWRFVNYEMMHNDERMLLIELIDELSDGIFEPVFDDLGTDRRQVTIEMYVHPTKHTALKSVEDAIELLATLGASARLLKHHKLVAEAGLEIMLKLNEQAVPIDKNFVDVGIAVHDVGKIVHPDELDEGGNLHEAAGEQLLVENGVLPQIARCCRSHAQYDHMSVSLEELVIALADALWKGARNPDLEQNVIDAAAERIGVERWHLFEKLDSGFEEIARTGDQRLYRSMPTYDEMMEERARFIGPPQQPHPPKMQPKMKTEQVDQKSQNDTIGFMLSKLTKYRRQ